MSNRCRSSVKFNWFLFGSARQCATYKLRLMRSAAIFSRLKLKAMSHVSPCCVKMLKWNLLCSVTWCLIEIFVMSYQDFHDVLSRSSRCLIEIFMISYRALHDVLSRSDDVLSRSSWRLIEIFMVSYGDPCSGNNKLSLQHRHEIGCLNRTTRPFGEHHAYSDIQLNFTNLVLV